tara:strand:+ start:137 stop:364 length:228 start_codon:yes stop_codon:yes gene_type:complete
MTSIETSFGYKTTITIQFDIDNYSEDEIISMLKEKLNIIKQSKTEDVNETIAYPIEDFDCDCYACVSGSSKHCLR